MDLKITKYNDLFKVEGNLNKRNIHVFLKEFQNIFESSENITISIEELEGIDRYGVNALAKLHNESITKNKSLSIVGLGCKDLYDHFKSNDAA
jgi:ABC-type transporter Mla MlaB component